MATFFTSDPHYWHANIIKFCARPYADVEEMNEALVRNWNEIVRPEDTVIVVGDFSLAFRSVETFTRRLNGRKILVAGNHDFCHSAHKKSRTPENQAVWTQKYLDNGWNEVHMKLEYDLPGVGIVNVSHLPYKGGGDSKKGDKAENGYEERYTEHRLEDDGRWLLCGHVHEKWKVRGRQLNVGVDVHNFRPVSEADVAKIILEAGK
jgi:calcineurin-like phosphoesterase family protein